MTRGVRVGGRSQRVVQAVLGAAVEELAQRGYAALQIEEVARAANVNRTSIYRRWPTKAKLVEAALREITPWGRPSFDTEDLVGDLLAMLRNLVRWQRTAQGLTVRRMVQSEDIEPELARIVRGLRKETLVPWTNAIERAKKRGEVARSVDTLLLCQMILATTIARLDEGDSTDLNTLTSIVSIAVAGARTGTARARKSRSPRTVAGKPARAKR